MPAAVRRCAAATRSPRFHASSGPNGTAIMSGRNKGANVKLKNGAPTEILSPVRTSSASGYPLQPVLELARRTGRWRDPLVRDRLTDLFVTEHALALTNLRSVAESRTSGGSPTGSITKLVLSELSQEISELGFELGAAQAAYWDDVMPPETHALLDSRRFTIAGGTSEVQRNIVAQTVLG